MEETPKFEISKQDQKYIKRVCNNSNIVLEEKIDILSDFFNKNKETIEEMINFLGMSLTQSQFSSAKLHTLKKSKRYIISSAQTASPVNIKFLNNIKAYAEFIDAEIGIIATRYRNPTSLWNEEGDVWDVAVHPYLTANRQFLHKNVLLLADLKIQATSPNPTNGIELFGDEASCIVGSPRIEMKSVPVLPSETQKFLWSTGSVTMPSFTDTVAGGKAEAHHTYGFIIVEIEDEEVVHLRSVSANNKGDFNDLIYRVEEEVISTEKTDCLIWGDSHFAKKDEEVTNAFRKLCMDLQISKSVLHDVWDSESINSHNLKNPVIRHELMKTGRDDLKRELRGMYSELNWFENHMEETIVVNSNHDDMLDRAMYQGDWRDNLKNSEIFIKMLSLTLSLKAPDGIIPYYINKKYKNIRALGLNDSYILYGVELALHGHKGANGSRGSINHFSRLSNKTIIGHSHSPGIRWGCYQVGVSCKLDHDYNTGLSGWAYSGVSLNQRGKRQLIVLNKNTLTYTTLY
ncbi:MAG: hypothetical protein PF569_02485 [Candidatus Woesearchaeota archaeon]|jgi:hypothetical protein|nr:hypothetical protein [Candidatus Woesearchaeota archaeon]